MQQTKYLVQVVKEALHERLADVLNLDAKKTDMQQNRIEVISAISQKETQRNVFLSKVTGSLYEFLKKQSAETLVQATRLVFNLALSLFRVMTPNFSLQKPLPRSDYRSLSELMRRYYVYCNDIKMIWRVDEVIRNKTLKKPLILIMTIRFLLESTREFHQSAIKILSRNITFDEIEEFQAIRETKNRSSIGFWLSDKLSVQNIDEKVQLRSSSQDRQILGLTCNDFRKNRQRTSSKVRQSHTNSALDIIASPMSRQTETPLSFTLGMTTCMFIKSSIVRPHSDLAFEFSKKSEVSTQTDAESQNNHKPVYQSIIKERHLKYLAKKRKHSFSKRQTQLKPQLFSKLYGILDVEDSELIAVSKDTDPASRAAEANLRLRNRYIQKTLQEEESRFRCRK